MNENLNISTIETYLYGVVKNAVSENVFVDTLPRALSDDVKEFVLIDCGNAINDFSSHGKGTLNVVLYAKPIANGCKNVAQLSRLEKALRNAIGAAKDERYLLTQLYKASDYDAVLGWHCIVVGLNIIVK